MDRPDPDAERGRSGPRGTLLQRLEHHLESERVLGFDIGHGRRIIDFLARLEMGDIEQLLGDAFRHAERERVLNMVEERKGELDGRELPPVEAAQRDRLLRMMRARRNPTQDRGL